MNAHVTKYWSVKRQILVSASATAISLAYPSISYAQSTAQTAQAPQIEEVVVTGSRVLDPKFESPTPVTVVGIEQLQAAAKSSIVDLANQMPALVARSTSTSQAATVNSSNSISNFNLRGLGANRTLVLMDGLRLPVSSLDASVDLNQLPDSLISRIDVVTGGASAAYGSDAISGVVNFVLDKNYTGIKGDIQGGLTNYGDDAQYKASIAGGTGFAGGRGHVLAFAQEAYSAGVGTPCVSGIKCNEGIESSVLTNPRPWMRNGWAMVANPTYTATNGQPQYVMVTHAAYSNQARGGVITSAGPLNGIYFGANGVPKKMQGDYISGSFIVGGTDWINLSDNYAVNLKARSRRDSFFFYSSYDITDDVQVFGRASYAQSYTRSLGCCHAEGSGTAYTVLSGNPFIPASVQTQMTALKMTSFTLGSNFADIGSVQPLTDRQVKTYVLGAKGKFDAADTTWSWDAVAQIGYSRTDYHNYNDEIIPNMRLAIDDVLAPDGSIACRSTLTNPNNGCVPFNIMGLNVNTPAALNYVTGSSDVYERYKENIVQFTLSGEPFSTWAGPVSVALGPEYRKEKVVSAADPLSLANGPGLGTAYYIGNFQPTNGQYTVVEGFVETGIPLAKDVSWAKRFDLSGAVRVTDYSTSGTVTTWKVGAVYQPVSDLRLRITRSRDIRAPNFSEAFSQGVNGRTPLTDRLHNNDVYSTVNTALGNPTLSPERSTTQTEGGTYAPSWFPGLTMSFDYFDINIKGGIASLGAQATIDQCSIGVQAACSNIKRGSDGLISVVYITPQNYSAIHAKGFDVDAGYRFRLDDISESLAGNITMRFSGSRSITLTSNNGVQTTQAVGQYSSGSVAPWRWFSSVGYNYDAATLTLMARGLSSGRWDNAWVGCTSGCPAATSLNPTVNNNYVPGRSYFDLSAAYKVMRSEAAEVEVFMTIDNILDTDPPQFSSTLSQYGWTPNTNTALFDVLGRVFRAGVRFKM